MTTPPQLTHIELHQRSRELELRYANGQQFRLPCEYLRVCSPSAEVRGHGRGRETLQTGKLNVAITAIEPVGNYGVKLIFSDGHDTGIYAWNYLYELATHHDQYWHDYLERLRAAGASRDPEVQVIQLGDWRPDNR
jgi:DUF971 family protein